MTRSLVTKKTDISYVRSSRNSNLMNMLQIMSVHISLGLVLLLDVAPFLKEKKGVRFREKESRSLLHDNIVPKPDLALELDKSISLTEAEEEAVVREVHATHSRIVSGPDPEPMQEDQTGSNSGKLHVSLAGPNPEHMDDEFLVFQTLILLNKSRLLDPQSEGTGSKPGVLDEEKAEFLRGSSPVPQFMAPDHSSSGPVLHEMTSDQIRSDLTPNRQETSVDNISSDLVSNKQKASDYDISGPVPPRKNVVSLADKTDSSQRSIEFPIPHHLL
ncbi:hypothetical protein Tco_0078741 [Tanacetum coccineum]